MPTSKITFSNLTLLAAVLCIAVSAFVVDAQPVTDHPRLWVRSSDLTRLRSWAVATNPVYQDGLYQVALAARDDMDANLVPNLDGGDNTWDQYPSEMYAELFAFMSLVDPDPVARADWAARAHTVLMWVMDRAVLGTSSGVAFRDPEFSSYDRSRWWGEGFGLTVDWIHGSFSSQELATIRTVFLRWAGELNNAFTTDHNHPEPVGVYNDPSLLSPPIKVRWAVNNYYLAHLRNLGLMALSFDPADDPGGALTGELQTVTGAWLYVTDHMLRTDARGGFSPEGFLYGPDALGSLVQFLLALHTAGQDDPATWGRQVVLAGHPFWSQMMPGFFHSLSADTVVLDEVNWLGELYQPAWFGDGQSYWLEDPIGLFGPLGVYDDLTSNSSRLQALRWAEVNTPPGGALRFIDRVADPTTFRDVILAFLLADPTAANPPDPRPALETTFRNHGVGRLLSRTDWSTGASIFTFNIGWIEVDHQLAEGNQVELYRSGEWLTKGRVGWDGTSDLCTVGRSDFHNTLAVENDQGSLSPTDWRYPCHVHGSQWIRGATSDGRMVAASTADAFVSVLGDATGLYNSAETGAADVLHVSRSAVWLKPDVVILYDRADTATSNRFKRLWLNLPTAPVVNGSQATMTTITGQHLHISSLLPIGATVSTSVMAALPDQAEGEPMTHRLLVEATGGPASARFLTVLEGADAGVGPSLPTGLASVAGDTFTGVAIGTWAVFFREDLGSFSSTAFDVPVSTVAVLVSGLDPGSSYDVSSTPAPGGGTRYTVVPGSQSTADEGGVLRIGYSDSMVFSADFESGDLESWS